uniref:Uncharacterized protein n=1 Tax=Anguilla anguilla TaxID=7936 RepID=A0A0E9TIJ5_ANGAN
MNKLTIQLLWTSGFQTTGQNLGWVVEGTAEGLEKM